MVLPPELYVYAENLYRRFPAEFVLLGMPGLEDIYDLRPSGSRSVWDSPAEKTISITLRRWPWQSMSTGQPPGAPHPMNGTMPAAMMQGPGVQQPAPAQPHEALRFNRLESALTKLMEQVQVILESEERAQPMPAPSVIPATMVQRAGFWGAGVPGFAQAPASAVPQQALQSQPQLQPQPAPDASMQPQAQLQPQPQGPPLQTRQGLASRRGAEESLQIDTKTAGAKSPVQVLHESDTKKDGVEIRRNSGESLAARRQKVNRSPSLNVDPVKNAANDDPVSPRSPGRFSAWK